MTEPTLQLTEAKSLNLLITLVDSEPTMWREVVVPKQITLPELHLVIQKAMGWENLHDYTFTSGIGKASYDLGETLASIAAEAQTSSLYYNYDFKSGWLHRLEIKSGLGMVSLGCSAGEMACPPEGTEGVWGYDDFLDRLEDPNDPEYMTLIEKYGDFDPQKFDVAAANLRVNELNQALASRLGTLVSN